MPFYVRIVTHVVKQTYFIVVAGFDNGDCSNPLNQCDYNTIIVKIAITELSFHPY